MLLFTLLAVCCASGCARGAVPAPAHDKPYYPEAAHARHFAAFKSKYNKQYATPEEEQRRFEIFKNNLKEINKLNAQYKETVYAINNLSDLTTEEFTSQYTGPEIRELTGRSVDKSSKPYAPPLANLSVEVPDAFDWRDRNVVTRVKDHKKCGWAWTSSTIGCLESQYAIKNNKLVEFSEQQLIDCDTNGDCNIGFSGEACRYLMKNGVMTESDYPYKGGKYRCTYDPKRVSVNVTKCQDYTASSEDDLKKILYTKGPLSIAIFTGPLEHYSRGILMDCGQFHASLTSVLLVGYGIENGVAFWTIRNSWGEQWGEKGYFRMKRGVKCLNIIKGRGSKIFHIEI